MVYKKLILGVQNKDKEKSQAGCLGTGCRSRGLNQDKISCICVCIISEFLLCAFPFLQVICDEILLTLLISILVFVLPSCSAY